MRLRPAGHRPAGALITRLREEEGVLVLPCGERSVRLRPALNIEDADLEHGVAALSRALSRPL
ncbi:hypothetical protein [Nonomuraea recticatena]|uniref:hypothetical protein n=1 Tax=Nonomuraea recticatena TaxID=46178 RepID=UPI00362044D2